MAFLISHQLLPPAINDLLRDRLLVEVLEAAAIRGPQGLADRDARHTADS